MKASITTESHEQTNIELYPLPASWKWVTVADAGAKQKHAIVDGPFGSNLKLTDYVEGGPVPVLTTKNLEGNYDKVRYISEEKFQELKRSAVYPGDLLVAKIGSCGKTGIYPQGKPPAMIPANLLKVTLNSDYDLKYVYYYFNSPFFQQALKTIVKATAQPAFGVSNFRTLPLPYAPPKQQKSIVAEIEKQFSRLDEAVANLKRVKANLKRYKAAVLKAAVEGKLTEEWRKAHPDVEPASELLKRILAERRAKWNGKGKYKEPAAPDTADLPSLPEGWIWVRWEQIALSQNGRAFPSKEYQAQGFKLLRPGNLHVSGKVVWNEENSRYLPELWATEFPEFIVGPHELIMNLTAQSLKDEFLGRVCLTGPEERCLLNQRLARLTPVEVLPEFLLWVFKSRVFRRFVEDLNTGSLIQHMFTSQLGDFVLPLPPLPEQTQIVAEVERKLSLIEELNAMALVNCRSAERLKQSVLQRAFAGQFRCSNWQ